MKRWLLLVAVIAAAGMAGTAGAEGKGPFSLEYCPVTPSSPNAKGTPNSLTAKFFPERSEGVNLYIGSGLAYSLPPMQDEYREAGTGVRAGLAGQAGVDYSLNDHTSLSLDYKYLHLAQDAARAGSEEPQSHLFGLNLKCRF
ncbi:MAG TPA: OmpW family outer membrane protein [Desulfuromonadaceae bacterium]